MSLATAPARTTRPRRRSRKALRHVLVIGGAGFVGSVLTRRLLERGLTITILDSLMYGDESIRDLYENPRLEVIQGDLRSIETVVRASRDADAIVHLGALVGDPACALDEALTLEVNLQATHMVVDVVRGLGIPRLIFASTCSVYGADDDLLDEESPLRPVSLYAKTKMDSEQVVLSMQGVGAEPVVLRFGTFYGPSPRPRFDLVVNLLIAKAVSEGEINVFGGGQWRPFLHVEDGAEAIIRCLEAPARLVSGQVFNVGSDDQNHTLGEIAEMISSVVPGVRIRFEGKAAAEANYRVSFARIRQKLGFQPRYSLMEGLLQLKALLEEGEIARYDDAKYSNYKTLVDTGTQQLRTAESPPGRVKDRPTKRGSGSR
jgi:nucleoside-diphosphate-sugar epimerase